METPRKFITAVITLDNKLTLAQFVFDINSEMFATVIMHIQP